MPPLEEKHNTNSLVNHPYKQIARQRWITSIERLRHGYTDKSGASYPPALITPNGCHLTQKKSNRQINGYIQIQPAVLSTTRAKRNEPKKIKDSPQLAHRIICYLTKCDNDVYNLLYKGYHASHLCHQPICINPDHLVIESKEANESRKICSAKVHVQASINGIGYLLAAEECRHSPPCIIRLESRTATEQ
ncbi:zinc-binding loop region of homing endonuclease-domain-containing protein [Lipomyces starkeyi]